MEGLEAGSIFAGDYRVLRTVYTGGLSIIYEVEQQSTGARRALKVVFGDLGHDTKIRDAFLAEAKRATRIQSDHVAEVLACGVDDSTQLPWVAMEMLEGESVSARMERDGPMSPADALVFLTQLCHALAAAHDVDVVHRDLKPEGIVLAKSRSAGVPYRVEVQFVGVGKIASDIRSNTTAAMARGLWMAPEQSETDAPITKATDVWTLGLLAFWVLTGRCYWKTARDMGSAMMSLMREILFEPIEPASKRAAEMGLDGRIPGGFDAWFARCVARDATKRFQHAREAFEALVPVLSVGAPVPVGPLPRPSAPPKREGASQPPAAADQANLPPKLAIDGTREASDRRSAEEAPMSLRSKRKFWRMVATVTGSLLLVAALGGTGYKLWSDARAKKQKEEDLKEEAQRDEEREAERKRRKALIEWTDEASPVPASYKDPTWGDRGAPVTIVLFSELECPQCKLLDTTLLGLKKVYGPKTLRLVWKHNPAPTHKQGRVAAITGQAVYRSTGSEAFFKYTAKGFSTANDSLYGFEIEDWVREAGVKKRADYTKYKGEKETEQKVDDDIALATTLGVKGSPAMFINGVLLKGSPPPDTLKSTIDDQIAKAKAETDKGTAADALYVALSKAQFISKEQRQKALEPPKEDDKAAVRVPIGESPVRGPNTALVTIVELGDFECPHCLAASKTMAELRKIYGDRIRIVWKDNPLVNHFRARPAANFAREVRVQKGDEGFWKAHDLLFENAGKLGEDDLKALAKKLGVKSPAAIDAANLGTYDAKIKVDQELAELLDATGTPTFYINGRKLVGAKKLDEFEAIIKEEEAKAQALVSKGTSASAVYDELMKSAKDPAEVDVKVVDPGPVPIGAPTRGGPFAGTSARVVIHHFGDIETPATQKTELILDRVVDRYKDQVQVVWRHRPLDAHDSARDLANAAEEIKLEVGNDAFFAFVKGASAKSTTPNAFDSAGILLLATEAAKISRYGYLSSYSLKSAVDEKKHEARIRADETVADRLGLTYVPTVIVGKYQINGAVTYGRVKAAVDKALKDTP